MSPEGFDLNPPKRIKTKEGDLLRTHSAEEHPPSRKSVIGKSLLLAIPITLATSIIIITIIYVFIAATEDTHGDSREIGSAFGSGIFWGFLFFISSFYITIPYVAVVISCIKFTLLERSLHTPIVSTATAGSNIDAPARKIYIQIDRENFISCVVAFVVAPPYFALMQEHVRHANLAETLWLQAVSLVVAAALLLAARVSPHGNIKIRSHTIYSLCRLLQTVGLLVALNGSWLMLGALLP